MIRDPPISTRTDPLFPYTTLFRSLRDFRTVTIPESAHLITWRVGDQGFEMHLSGGVPQRLAKALDAERLRNDRDGILRGEPAESYDLWAVHPGGRTILDAVERGRGLEADALGRSRSGIGRGAGRERG